jgi:hypothetical protein
MRVGHEPCTVVYGRFLFAIIVYMFLAIWNYLPRSVQRSQGSGRARSPAWRGGGSGVRGGTRPARESSLSLERDRIQEGWKAREEGKMFSERPSIISCLHILSPVGCLIFGSADA